MGTIDGLPPLREVIKTHDLVAKRDLGQNFLLDLNLTAKIARLSGDLSGCDVLEIGPGPGGLTRGLLAEGARRVLAVEKDARCMAALEEISAVYPGRLQVINADALELDATAYLTAPFRVIANLAHQVTDSAHTPVDKVIAIRNYFLSKNENGEHLYKYTDNPGEPDIPNASKLMYFLT
ncbi:MAG: hypothetical protein H7173_09105, partial [Rhodoferax sp.]|nr:hypothetical protein [Pseudorhodobacter sp.]